MTRKEIFKSLMDFYNQSLKTLKEEEKINLLKEYIENNKLTVEALTSVLDEQCEKYEHTLRKEAILQYGFVGIGIGLLLSRGIPLDIVNILMWSAFILGIFFSWYVYKKEIFFIKIKRLKRLVSVIMDNQKIEEQNKFIELLKENRRLADNLEYIPPHKETV